MSLEGYARFLEAQGLPVFEAEGSLWVEKRRFFFENIPPHRKLHLSPAAVGRLLLKGCAVVRYACAEPEGAPSFEYVCTDKDFGLQTLAPDARRRVRRGMETCEVRRVEFDLLARHGYAINRSTLLRQGRPGAAQVTEEARWRSYMQACASIPSLEAYGAFLEGRFIGFSISVILENYSYLHHTQAYTEELKHSPLNVLTYLVTKAMLERPQIEQVSQGLEPFLPLPSVERFKLAMGFRKRPLARRVVVNPIARPALSAAGVWLARKALGKRAPGLAEDFATFARSVMRECQAPFADAGASSLER